MKYFINTTEPPTEKAPKQLVIVSEDGREFSADAKTIDEEALRAFMDTKKYGKAEVWAYNAKEWWSDFHSTFGLPKSYHALEEWHQELGAPTLPAPPVNASPREQAVWNRDVWAFLERYAGQVTGEGVEEEPLAPAPEEPEAVLPVERAPATARKVSRKRK